MHYLAFNIITYGGGADSQGGRAPLGGSGGQETCCSPPCVRSCPHERWIILWFETCDTHMSCNGTGMKDILRTVIFSARCLHNSQACFTRTNITVMKMLSIYI